MQVELNHDPIEEFFGVTECSAREMTLASVVTDAGKLDNLHIIASVGNSLEVWKRPADSHGFIADFSRNTARVWQEPQPIHLVTPRPTDSAVLFAGV